MFGLVKETADFMADFAVENRENGEYDLLPPIIPAQERHAPRDTVNPAFEVEYWRFGLSIAVNWAKRKKSLMRTMHFGKRWGAIWQSRR